MTDVEEPLAATCPHCGSSETRPISYFGAGEMTMQYHCRRCGSAFERVKWNDQGP